MTNYAGYHRFNDGSDFNGPHGSFEVFYLRPATDREPGWYWWACFPGCLPDGEPNGPFASARDAFNDAQEF